MNRLLILTVPHRIIQRKIKLPSGEDITNNDSLACEMPASILYTEYRLII
jgi:hypothetical protein